MKTNKKYQHQFKILESSSLSIKVTQEPELIEKKSQKYPYEKATAGMVETVLFWWFIPQKAQGYRSLLHHLEDAWSDFRINIQFQYHLLLSAVNQFQKLSKQLFPKDFEEAV